MERNEYREKPGGKVERYEIMPPYHKRLLDDVPKLARPLKVVVDAGSGVGGPVAPPIFRQLGCQVWEIACVPDVSFPFHHPDPTVPENLEMLIEKVRQEKADLGIAYDGDADRIGVVNEKGSILWGDELLVLFSRDVLKRNPGATIIADVKCSQRLYDDVSAHGGRPIMWKAGHSLVKAKMKETRALLAGEMSGHMFFKERYFGYDDAIYASLRLLEILAQSGKTVILLACRSAQERIDSGDSRGLPGRKKIYDCRKGNGIFPPTLRCHRSRRRSRAISRGLGTDSRVKHAAGACAAL